MRRNDKRSGPTVSQQAADSARMSKPFRVPLPLPPRLVPPLLRAVRRRFRRIEEPYVAELRKWLVEDVTHHDVDGVPVVEIVPRSAPDDVRERGDRAVYLHGGAYFLGSACDGLAVMMADELRLPVFCIDYDLAPESVFPAALEQAVRAHTALAAAGGRTVLFGVSSGAGLALSLVNRLHREGLPLPRALGLFTPWTDLTGTGDSYRANEGRDRAIRWRYQLERAARAYAGATPARHPGISPIYDTYPPDYPPSMITTGTRDLFLSDCVRLYWALRAVGAPTELRVWEGMWHSLPDDPGMPEAQACRAEVAGFLRRALQDADAPHDGNPESARATR
ncbi:alpha/beta hydrolase [Actinosynnema sp. NPDC050436]|uniref:alpha/beta hydrolase n=1 Tax=Actinosynnema sp. NPDC050436 TaxID=3155659 RepID=UPI0033E0B69B